MSKETSNLGVDKSGTPKSAVSCSDNNYNNSSCSLPFECKDHDDVNLHVWAFLQGVQNRCSLLAAYRVKLASLGENHTLFLTDKNVLYSLGENGHGQLGLGDFKSRKVPCQVTTFVDTPVLSVACGARHSGVLSNNGQVYCWGDSRQGQCGLGERGLFTTPCRVQFIEANDGTAAKIHDLSLGGIHSLAIDYKGILWAFGTGAALGLGLDLKEALVPTKVTAFRKKRAVAIAAGEFHSLAVMQEEFHGSHLPLMMDETKTIGASNSEKSHVGNAEAGTIPFLQSEFYSIEATAIVDEQSSGNQAKVNSSNDILGNSTLSQEPSFCTTHSPTNDTGYILKGSLAQGNTSLDEQSLDRNQPTNLYFENRLFDRHTTGPEDLDSPARETFTESSPATLSFTNRLYSEQSKSSLTVSEECVSQEQESLVGVFNADVQGSEVTESQGASWKRDVEQCASNTVADDLSSMQILQQKKLSGSVQEVFKSALDIFSSDIDNSNLSSSNSTREELFKTDEFYFDFASTQAVPIKTRTDIVENLADAESDWEVKKNPQPSQQPRRGSLFAFKGLEERRKQNISTWSLVSSYSPSDIELQGLAVPIAGKTEVWGWGKNSSGQLGIGDTKERSVPVCISKLSGKRVFRVVAGSNHSMALTNSCQVYSWGANFTQNNSEGDNSVAPVRLKTLSDVRVWDIAAGKNLSLFLGDSCESGRSDVYFCGAQERKPEKSSSVNSQETAPSERTRNGKKGKKLSQRVKRTTEGSTTSAQNSSNIKKIVHFRNEVLLRCAGANFNQFSCLTERVSDSNLAIYEFARSERTYYCQLAMIHFVVLEPLRQSDQWTSNTKLPGGETLLRMVDSFNDLLNGVAAGLCQLTDVVRNGRTAKDLFSFLLSDSFRGSYDRFSTAYCDALAIGQIHSCNKIIRPILGRSLDAMTKALKEYELVSFDLDHLLKIPLNRHKHYQVSLEKIVLAMKELSDIYSSSDVAQMEEVKSRWYIFEESNEIRIKEAEETRLYWEECPGKLTELLKEPQRRLLRTSKTEPLFLARALRISKHSYVLFNDVFVHIQFNRNFQVFPLVTMWAEPEKETDPKQHAFRISSPEQSFVLCAASKEEKTTWLCEINKAIASCLSVSSSHCIDITAVNMTLGTLTAAAAREAWYTYVNHPQYKGARYTGMWLNGQPHGSGRLEWPDGTYYEGEFERGNFQGYGIMVHRTSNQGDMEKRYEGEWKEGKMCGFGKMNYGYTEEYLGHWNNSVRSGHGTLKQFSANASLQTVYVGDWDNDQRHGYGVLDLIVRGEKYMGMWASDQRYGQGIVVTVDGVYYEGKFVQNKLVGKGILLSDDDTCYEGEFTADMLLNGKGLLTFQNGDYIDGTFSGKWGDGIVVNGTFSKFANQDPGAVQGDTSSFHGRSPEFTVLAEQKWKSLFQECKETMGYGGVYEPNEYEVWVAVQSAVLKSEALSSLKGLTRSDFGQELLAQGGRVENRAELVRDLKSLQNYVERAFNTFGHPLSTLVDSLVEVYRTTYVGVGAHRRLLQQAVAEAKSYVTRLFAVIRLLFPDLHDEEFVLLTNSTVSGVVDVPIDSSSLLHPILLPRLYPTLFTLYALHTEKGDAIYAERLHLLNKRNALALMSFLSVARKFWLVHKDAEENTGMDSVASPYQSAIDTLGAISTSYSPMEKISVLRQSFAKLHDDVDSFWNGENKIGCMDDLFPVFHYIVVRARIPHLGSEIQFIEDLVEPTLLVGEAGHMVTTLKACYFQIQREQDRE